MSSNVYGNPVINRTGTVPGVIQGPTADRPERGYVDGDWFMDTTLRILYRWDEDSSTWIAILDYFAGGGGLTGSLTTDVYPVATGATSLGDGQIVKINSTDMRFRIRASFGSLSGTPDPSAAIDITGANGFMTGRVTEAQRTGITSPGTGLMVFQTNNTIGLYYYNGTTWVFLSGSGISGLTTNNLPLASSATTLADSPIKINGTTVNLGGSTNDVLFSKHIVEGNTAISIVADANLGTGGTAAISGGDIRGVITLTTGSASVGGGNWAQVTFGTAYTAAPKAVLLVAADDQAASLEMEPTVTTKVFANTSGITAGGFPVKAYIGGLGVVSTNLACKWYYFVMQ